MPPENQVPGSPVQWLRYAMSDLELARAKPANVMLEMLCFHAQQAAEKSIKAVLIAEYIEFPRTHNLRILFDLLAGRIDIPREVLEAAILTDYAVASRYPGDVEPVMDEEYEEALALAKAVVDWAGEIIQAPPPVQRLDKS